MCELKQLTKREEKISSVLSRVQFKYQQLTVKRFCVCDKWLLYHCTYLLAWCEWDWQLEALIQLWFVFEYERMYNFEKVQEITFEWKTKYNWLLLPVSHEKEMMANSRGREWRVLSAQCRMAYVDQYNRWGKCFLIYCLPRERERGSRWRQHNR